MKSVSMSTLSTCPWYQKTKKYFTDHNIPFKFVDYDLQPVAGAGADRTGDEEKEVVRFRSLGCSSATISSSAGTLRNTRSSWH